MNAPDIEKPDLKGYTPIAVIGMSDPEEGIAHGLGTYWLKEDSIIVKRGSEESPTYKIIDDEYYVEELTKIIKKQVDLYKELYQG